MKPEYYGDIPPQCPYCKSEAEFVDSKTICGKSYGMVWKCRNHPHCDARVGVHRNTNIPLGRMADKQLRDLKQAVHKFFDPLWKEVGFTRTQAYNELSVRMGVPREYCHIGMFDKVACKRALDILRNWDKEFFLRDKIYLGIEVNSKIDIYLDIRYRMIPKFVRTEDGFFRFDKSDMYHELHYKAGHKYIWRQFEPGKDLDELITLADKDLRKTYKLCETV